jgi:hypothetical protein
MAIVPVLIRWGFVIVATEIGGGSAPCQFCDGTAYRTVEKRRWFCLSGLRLIKREIVSVTNECSTCERVVEFY